MKESERLLAAGIRAAQVKQHDKARELLLRVIEIDEENEEAWLWLSGSVDELEDKRICLENVLTLNPDNVVAPLRLAELDDRSGAFARGERAQLTSEPLHGALNSPYHPYTVAKNNRYDDVWTRDQPLCSFCATPVKQKQRRCSNCWRKLSIKVPTYPIPSHYHEWLTLYLVLMSVLSTALIILVAFVGILPNIRVLFRDGVDNPVLLLALLPLPVIILTIGVYRRYAWAYWLLAIDLGIQFLGILAFALASVELFIGTFIFFAPIYLLYGWLLYLLLRAWPDFERRKFRRVATVAHNMTGPYELDKAAQTLANKGQWASAILHWRRAVGNAGGNGFFQWRLGKAYAKLGFYERAVDEVGEAVMRLESEPKEQAKARKELARLKRKVA